MTTLYVRDGNQFREASAKVVIDRAKALIAQRFRPGTPVLSAPKCTREFLCLKLGALEHEVFSVLYLDLCVAARYVELGSNLRLFSGFELPDVYITAASPVHPIQGWSLTRLELRRSKAIRGPHYFGSGVATRSMARVVDDHELRLAPCTM